MVNVDLVRQMQLFDSVGRRDHPDLAALCAVVDVPAGVVLVREGGPSRGFFVVLDGVAAVTSRDQALVDLGPGDFFGEIGLLGRAAATTATVTTASPMRLVVMAAQEFLTLCTRWPGVATLLDEARAARAA
jgi:CRP-like cAMP-binding protein